MHESKLYIERDPSIHFKNYCSGCCTLVTIALIRLIYGVLTSFLCAQLPNLQPMVALKMCWKINQSKLVSTARWRSLVRQLLVWTGCTAWSPALCCIWISKLLTYWYVTTLLIYCAYPRLTMAILTADERLQSQNCRFWFVTTERRQNERERQDEHWWHSFVHASWDVPT